MNKTTSPRYVIDLTRFRENCQAVMDAFNREWDGNTIFSYSVKTNRNSTLIQYADRKLGWYIEMVSPDEYHYCSGLGIAGNRMILNGPCKEELMKESSLCVDYINLDNLDEVKTYCQSSVDCQNVGLRINMNLEKVCPKETTAGDEVSRFGIDDESQDLDTAIELLKIKTNGHFGIHLHTSTKSRSTRVFQALSQKAVELKERYQTEFSFIDIGGGFFGGQKVPGKPTMEEYASVICNELKQAFTPEHTRLILEPGASVLATCVTYTTKVINVREIRGTRVITLDGTLLHVNPFMSKRNQPFHLEEDISSRDVIDKQIICGMTCMENDRFGVINNERELCKGDTLVFHFAGAYTMAFNSHFIIEPPHIEIIEE